MRIFRAADYSATRTHASPRTRYQGVQNGERAGGVANFFLPTRSGHPRKPSALPPCSLRSLFFECVRGSVRVCIIGKPLQHPKATQSQPSPTRCAGVCWFSVLRSGDTFRARATPCPGYAFATLARIVSRCVCLSGCGRSACGLSSCGLWSVGREVGEDCAGRVRRRARRRLRRRGGYIINIYPPSSAKVPALQRFAVWRSLAKFGERRSVL